MKDRIKERFRKNNWEFGTRFIYAVFLIIIFILTVMIFIDAPVQRHFKNIGKNDVWFGSGWSRTDNGEPVPSKSKHYIRVQLTDGHVSITKTLDFTPSQDEFLCFRARALDTVIYVNGEKWYELSFQEKYRTYGKRAYLLHHAPAYGMKKGDQITIELYTAAGGDYSTIQFPAIGDRYALTMYILKKSSNSLAVCGGVLLLILLNLLTIRSAAMAGKTSDRKSLWCLTGILALSVVYLGTDSGCMEIFTERPAIIGWINNLSMILLPLPFMLFMKYAFFPGHVRYETLAFAGFTIAAVSVAAYVVFAVSMSNFYIFVHGLIVLAITACVVSFLQEKMPLPPEVFTGFGALIVLTLASILSYWRDLVYPRSILFGYGLLTFGGCMLFSIVRNRYELDSMREAATHVIMQRDRKAAQEASEQKSRFLSHMSHEIRTPLNAILGMNELILHDTDDAGIKKYASVIQSAGRTLLALINDVLDYSKIETGKVDIAESQYSLSSMLNDAVLMIQGRARDKGLEFQLDIDASLPDLLYGDEIRVKQILLNLMTNAVKYTKEGWIRLDVEQQKASAYLDDENIILDIRVSDSGIGIRKEELPELFTEFERLDRQRNKSIEGSGLGLSITSRLISLMKGSISVESEYGRGSLFRVLIPQTVLSQTPIGDYKKRFEILSNTESAETPEIMLFPGRHIFVVDDNELNLEVIASILEMFEVQVDRADSGQAAIDYLDRTPCDMILTDDMMPEISGTDLMYYLHAHEESANHRTPIVVLTANAVSGAREEYINKGFDEYMSKPIDAEVLQKMLMKFLK